MGVELVMPGSKVYPTLPDEKRIEMIAHHVQNILELCGEDPTRSGLRETPKRVAKMYLDVFSGLREEGPGVTVFDNVEEYRELVVLTDIPFASVCEHHLLPFVGVAHVGYLPNSHYLGLSKIVRVVEHFSRRPQVQERLVGQIAGYIQQSMDAPGVMVVIEAEHMCMTIRGVKAAGTKTTTAAIRPDEAVDDFPKEEFLDYVRRGRR